MQRTALRTIAAIALPMLVGGGGCSSGSDANARRYQLAGIVMSVQQSPARIEVAHDRIEGLMPAMTMAFEARQDGPPVREGHRIVATLVVTDVRSWLEDVRITGDGNGTGLSVPPGTRAAAGVVVPAFRLLDQDGRERSLHDFAPRILIVTFIYTRCPLPDFCPLIVKHLESIRRRANDAGMGDRLALLGVTLDPSFDTPAVLRAYGQSVLRGPDAFDQWTLATGSAAQVSEVAGFFGVAYRPDAGFVTHTLTTIVVNHEGRVVRVFPSNSWTPDDMFTLVTQVVNRAVIDGEPRNTKE
jgi:protein SCO1